MSTRRQFSEVSPGREIVASPMRQLAQVRLEAAKD
jgi:hypothetical protein